MKRQLMLWALALLWGNALAQTAKVTYFSRDDMDKKIDDVRDFDGYKTALLKVNTTLKAEDLIFDFGLLSTVRTL